MGTFVCDCVKCLLCKCFERSIEEFILVRSFDNELEDLKRHLEISNQDIEQAERREITGNPVKRWLRDLEDAVFDAKNALDEIDYEDSRRKIQTRYKIKPNGCLNIPCCTNLAFQWKMAHKMKDINAKFEAKKGKSGIFDHIRDHPKPVLETTSFTVDPTDIERTNEESKILETIASSNNNVLSVLPIVGMGGIGKTTLARNIYHQVDTQTDFGKTIWVCVSNNFDQQTVFEKILQLLSNQIFSGGAVQVVLEKIKEELKELQDKRYLIVLDDLWNEDKVNWKAFKKNLEAVSPNKGNFIIVTTRNEKVASIVNTFSCPYRLRPLINEQCWSIITSRAFPEGVPIKFGNTKLEIAGKCRGLPLAADAMGSVLRENQLEEELNVLWNGDSILEKSWKRRKEEDVLQVLKLSYNRLPFSAKKYFAYCSIFIKDSVIYREDLIQLWMAVEPLSISEESEESEGNIFKYFLDNFFFHEPEKDEYGNIMSCKMRNFFHDLACFVSKSDDIFQVRNLATTSIGEGTQEKASHLRLLSSKSSIPDEILSYFEHLHALKLCDADIKELPTSIGTLKHLRYLDVSYNDDLTTLPESICKLYNLQTLRILSRRLNFQRLERLPKDLQFLICLKHLCFNCVSDDFKMPPKIGSLTCLQKLTIFCVGDGEGCRIDELGKLTKLKDTLKIQNLELVSGKTEAEKADMAGKLDIYELHFQWRVSTDGNNRDTNAIESNINDESVLDGLMPHENLKGLLIEGFRGKNFPVWARNMEINKGIDGRQVIFNTLIKMEFINCHECKEIPMLGHLPILKYLRLYGLSSVKLIRSSFYGKSDCSSTSNNDGQETRGSFPSLKSLTIEEMPNLTDWEEAQTGRMQVFHCLEYLKLSNCEKLTRVPNLRGSRASRTEVEISGCDGLKGITL